MEAMRQSVLAVALALGCGTHMACAQPTAANRSTPAATPGYNVKSFGASGADAKTTLGNSYANWSEFVAREPWAANPRYGMQFAFRTTAPASAGATVLAFNTNYTSGTAGGWQAIVPAWMDPMLAPTEPNNVIYVGMLVIGAGLAPGTTVQAVGNDPTSASSYGTITLSNRTSGAIAAGTSLTFQMPIAKIQSATTDWLAFQRATYAADHAGNGAVYIPGGTYNLNLPVRRAGSLGGSPVDALSSVAYVGDGASITKIAVTADTSASGTDSCAFMTSSRKQGGAEGTSFRDFTLFASGFSEGAGPGTFPNRADGLCVGPSSDVYRVLVTGFRAGINVSGDHIRLIDANFSGNGYGVYIAPFQNSNGGVTISNNIFIGNRIAGFAVSTTAQYDSSVMTNTHLGYEPFGFYLEPQTASVAHGVGFYRTSYMGIANNHEGHAFLTNCKFDEVFFENIGNAAIYGAGEVGGVTGNVFVGGGNFSVGAPYATANPTWISGIAVNAPIFVGAFSNNTMINTVWAYPYSIGSNGVYGSEAYYTSNGTVTAAIIRAKEVNNNKFSGDNNIATGASLKFLPFIADGGAVPQNNAFDSVINGSGVFKSANGAITAAGLPLSVTNYGGVQPFVAEGAFAGVSAAPAPAGGVVGVIQRVQNFSVRKANPTENIDPAVGTPVKPVVGGFVAAKGADMPVAVAVNAGRSGNTTVNIDLDPIYNRHN
jgi:hypothetical protein